MFITAKGENQQTLNGLSIFDNVIELQLVIAVFAYIISLYFNIHKVFPLQIHEE